MNHVAQCGQGQQGRPATILGPEMSTAESVVVSLTKTELWVIRSAGAAILAVLGWIGVQFHGAVIHIAEIRKELELVKPADVLDAVRHLEQISLTEEEVARIISTESPWEEDRKDWERWQAEVIAWKGTVVTALQALQGRSGDRWTKTDHDLFLRRLKELNPDLRLPE